MPENGTTCSGARKHISSSSAALECIYCIPENENAVPVCYLQWMRRDSVGHYPFFGSSFGD